MTGSRCPGLAQFPAVLSAFADVSIYQLLLVAGVALFASVLGGVAGYGTGALMPLILVPMVGAEKVVPIIALAGMLTNTGRVIAFCRHVEWRRALDRRSRARSRPASSPPTATRC